MSQQTLSAAIKTATDAANTATAQANIATLASKAAQKAQLQAAGSAGDRVQTGEDRIQTGLDRVATAADRVATAADRAQTGQDRTAASNSAASATASAAVLAVAATYATNRGSVRLATNGALPANTANAGTGTLTMNATGVLTVDGTAVVLNDDIVVKDEAATTGNGVYRCTTAGAVGVAAVLTRRTTENTAAGLGASCVQVAAGTVFTGWVFLCQQPAAGMVLGTTGITFSGSPSSVAVEAAARLTVDNGVLGQLNAITQAITTLKASAASLQGRMTSAEALLSSQVVAVASILHRMELIGDLFAKADYYISSVNPSASDVNNGTSAATPWATMAPLVALGSAAGALSGKKVAFERGGVYAPMDMVVFSCDDAVFFAYGPSTVPPFFDCTAAVPAAWVLHAAGVWKVSLARSAAPKNFGNYFRGGVPMRKVASVAALAGLGNNVTFVENETSASPTLYMNAAADPGTDGSVYRFSKFSIAVCLNGSRNRIDGLWARGSSAQDGAFKIGGGIGGNGLTRCLVEWGSRHSAYVGSGVKPSFAEFNFFRGGSNDIETGGVVNTPGSANGLVFNSPDHSAATCFSRYNVFDGMGFPNYPAGSRANFTGPYGHDGTEGNPMLRFESIGDVFIDTLQGAGACGRTNLFSGQSFTRAAVGFSINAPAIAIEMTGTVEGSAIDRLCDHSVQPGVSLNYHDNGTVSIPDCGAGAAGWLRAGEGSTSTLDAVIERNAFNIQGVRLTNVNRKFIRIRAGSLKFKNNKVGPNLAPPVTLLLELGIGAGVCTLDAGNGSNQWPLGSDFAHAGVTYKGLQAWQTAGKETGSSYLPLPTPELTDSFTGADANLGSTPGWGALNGAAADLQRKSGKLFCNTASGTASVFKRGDLSSDDQYVRFTLLNTASSGGAAVRITDASNAFYIRSSATQIQVLRILAGAVAQVAGTSGITPASGNDVICVIRRYLDPVALTYSMRLWLIVDGAQGATLIDVTQAGWDQVRGVGALGRAVTNTDLLDDLQYGPAPLALV